MVFFIKEKLKDNTQLGISEYDMAIEARQLNSVDES